MESQMLTGEQFRQRITANPNSRCTFLLSEILSITTADFPPGAEICINCDISKLGPGTEMPWSVKNGRFQVGESLRLSQDTPNVPVSPDLLARIGRVAIEERARSQKDILFVSSVSSPATGVAVEMRYIANPPETMLLQAYTHYKNLLRFIAQSVNKAAHTKTVPILPKYQKNRRDVERRMFEHAEAVRNSADLLYLQSCGNGIANDVREILIDAAISNRALATELYMKCLYRIIEKKRLNNEHDLKKIFRQFKKADRDKIVAYFYERQSNSHIFVRTKAEFPDVRHDFGYALAVSRLAFVRYRYAYEMKKGEDGFCAGIIPIAVRRFILEERPNWTVLSTASSVVTNPDIAFVAP
jgi:hypothetical protein